MHTNTVADQLAPGVRLPLEIDAWATAAQLRDVDGTPLSDGTHPLSRIARSEPVLGQAVSAARVSELGERQEPLWVVALPMVDAPMLADHALVVLLPLRERAAVQAATSAAQQQTALREQAVLSTGLSFTVADAVAPDRPLVWVNPAFTAATGYSFADSVGRNCRFLQGEGTDPATRALMREVVDAGRDETVVVLNYRKDGTAFWNQLSLSPIHGPTGELTHYVGIQVDVTASVVAGEDRDRALAAERRARLEAEEARAAAEAAQGRLALLAEATSQLAVTLDVTACRQRLLDLVVPGLADWALLLTTDERDTIETAMARHVDPDRTEDVDRYVTALRRSLVAGSPQQTLLQGASARRVSDYDSPRRRAERERWVTDPAVLDLSDTLGAASALFVTLPGRRGSSDVMVLVRGASSPRHTEDDLEIAVDLGRRAGLILDNARLYEQQHTIAETLQSSLLPSLPSIPGIRAAARYRAAVSGAQVGGDFYELIALPGGAIGLAIGDVVGHDVMAAAAMGHLRGLLRACAWDPVAGPDTGRVLERVDELLAGLGMGTLATLTYARLEPGSGGGWSMTHSSAGHPPLLVRDPAGRVTFLDEHHDLLLGVSAQHRTTARHHLAPGSTVLAYTDGLVERRGEHLNEGLARLATALGEGPEDLDELCGWLLARLGSEGDDIAVLALTV
ncbi:SpoIIE family protein phosphatase [Kineococcus sp. GCM10028916]|uniref:PP2C family protein-serine/threonine phosphatase n=1 Tax=Kineococcus sp. GCM10028916 TaxID=3273394 RepID=UPI00363FA775